MLAGRSNVGKSTLLNALVGSKIAIVTPKAQTTRHPVRGILHDARGQIVFVDTPGVFLGKKDIVSKKLNQFVKDSLEGVDAIVYVMDPTRELGPEEENIQRLLKASSVPIVIAINKQDLKKEERRNQGTYERTDVGQQALFLISAAKHRELNRLVDELFKIMPEGEAWYEDQQMTDLSHKSWLEELIREKVFLSLEQELPYSTAVVVDEIEDGDTKKIAATILTNDERYKGMIIGAKGSKLKEIGMKARKELEEVLQQKIFLELTVKVDPKWPERFGR